MQNITLLVRILCLSLITMLIGCSASDGRHSAVIPAVAVTLQEVELSSTDQQISYSGTIEEALSVPLSFSVPGTVTEV